MTKNVRAAALASDVIFFADDTGALLEYRPGTRAPRKVLDLPAGVEELVPGGGGSLLGARAGKRLALYRVRRGQ